MRVTRYVSDWGLENLRKGFTTSDPHLRTGPNDKFSHEITLDVPDPPLEIKGYVCEDETSPDLVCERGCCGWNSEERKRLNCRPVTLVEKEEK